MTITAIETSYAGCRFRSRLEARWAVFFDHLGIAWQYEPQGFMVGGRPYLPDFYLTDQRLWVEVKGSEDALDVDLMIAAATPAEGYDMGGLPRNPEGALYRDGTRNGPKLLILGPIPRPVGQVCHSVIWFHKGDYSRHWASWLKPPELYINHDGDTFANDSGNLWPLAPFGLVEAQQVKPTDSLRPWVNLRVLDAYQTARSARFERYGR